MLMWEHCKIKVEQTAIQEELPMATVVREVAEVLTRFITLLFCSNTANDVHIESFLNFII